MKWNFSTTLSLEECKTRLRSSLKNPFSLSANLSFGGDFRGEVGDDNSFYIYYQPVMIRGGLVAFHGNMSETETGTQITGQYGDPKLAKLIFIGLNSIFILFMIFISQILFTVPPMVSDNQIPNYAFIAIPFGVLAIVDALYLFMKRRTDNMSPSGKAFEFLKSTLELQYIP